MAGYIPGAIRDKTGNKMITWTVSQDDTFAVVTPFASFNYGHISTSLKGQQAPVTVLRNEKGDSVQITYDKDLKFTATLMQTDKALFDKLVFDNENTMQAVYYRRDGINGKTQEWFFAGGYFAPMGEVGSPNGSTTLQLDWTGIKNGSAVTISTTTLASIGAYVTAAVTIPAGQGLVLIETANP